MNFYPFLLQNHFRGYKKPDLSYQSSCPNNEKFRCFESDSNKYASPEENLETTLLQYPLVQVYLHIVLIHYCIIAFIGSQNGNKHFSKSRFRTVTKRQTNTFQRAGSKPAGHSKIFPCSGSYTNMKSVLHIAENVSVIEIPRISLTNK